MKGLRKILCWTTTYIERENTNTKLMKAANKELLKGDQGTPIIKVSKYIRNEKVKYIGHLIREAKTEPTRMATFYGEAKPDLGNKKRIGRKKNSWIKGGLKTPWKRIRHQVPQGYTENGHHRKYHRRCANVELGLVIAADLRLF